MAKNATTRTAQDMYDASLQWKILMVGEKLQLAAHFRILTIARNFENDNFVPVSEENKMTEWDLFKRDNLKNPVNPELGISALDLLRSCHDSAVVGRTGILEGTGVTQFKPDGSVDLSKSSTTAYCHSNGEVTANVSDGTKVEIEPASSVKFLKFDEYGNVTDVKRTAKSPTISIKDRFGETTATIAEVQK